MQDSDLHEHRHPRHELMRRSGLTISGVEPGTIGQTERGHGRPRLGRHRDCGEPPPGPSTDGARTRISRTVMSGRQRSPRRCKHQSGRNTWRGKHISYRGKHISGLARRGGRLKMRDTLRMCLEASRFRNRSASARSIMCFQRHRAARRGWRCRHVPLVRRHHMGQVASGAPRALPGPGAIQRGRRFHGCAHGAQALPAGFLSACLAGARRASAARACCRSVEPVRSILSRRPTRRVGRPACWGRAPSRPWSPGVLTAAARRASMAVGPRCPRLPHGGPAA